MDTNESVSFAGSLATEYRRIWETSAESPDVFEFLSSRGPRSPRQCLEILKVDLRFRWKQGVPLPIKVYLSRLPELARSSDLVRLLVESDRRNRREFGTAPEPGSGDSSLTHTQVIVETDDRATVAEEPPPDPPTTPYRGPGSPAPSPIRDTVDQGVLPSRLGFQLESGVERQSQSERMRTLIDSSRFILLDQLGVGGMGVVYEAYDQDRGELIALKTMRQVDQMSLVRFKQEFRTLSDLSHPNLINLYQLFAVEPPWYFTMELVDGCDFLAYVRGMPESDAQDTKLSDQALSRGQRLVRRSPPVRSDSGQGFGEDRLRDALAQLVEGVHALHQAGKLHRDIKPTNILVSRRGRVKLLDFGLIAELGPTGEHRDTDRQVVGTLAHMSPEQAVGLKVSRASDWYSVGVVLYQALTGRLPFEGSYDEVVRHKLRSVPASPDSLVDGLPSDLVGLCMDLLKQAPSERPDGPTILARLGGTSERVEDPPKSKCDVPLIGRSYHRQILDNAHVGLLRGRSAAVFVQGRAGTGKTALVRSFLADVAAEENTVMLSGRCYERECVTYKALDSLIDSLARYLKQLSFVEREDLLPEDISLLSRVFLVLKGLDGRMASRESSPVHDLQEIRRRGFAALRELLTRLGRQVNLILAIDDLQWGDADSAMLLAELLYGPAPPRLLFLGCFRTEDLHQSRLLPILRQARLTASGSIDHHDLAVGPLSLAESRELARRLLGNDGGSLAMAHLVSVESEGNPLFIEELVRHAQPGELSTCGESAVRLNLDSVLRGRIVAQPADAQRLLEVISVAGRPIQETLAFQAASLGPAGRIALGSLRSSRLIRNLGEGQVDAVETYHDRIRDAVRQNLSPQESQAIHEKLARLLEGKGGTDPEVLADHFCGAKQFDRACEYFLEAAERAFSALAFHHAARLFQSALEVHRGTALSERQICRRLAEALASSGKGAEASRYFLRAAEGATAADGLELRRLAATQLLINGQVEQGLSLLGSDLGSFGLSMPASPRQALFSLIRHRAILRLRGTAFRPRDVSQLSAEQVTRIDLCWSAAAGLSVIDPILGADFQTRGLLQSLRAGEPFRIARSMAMESAHRATAGNRGARRAEALLRTTETLADRLDSPQIWGMLDLARAVHALMLGRWGTALESADRAAARFRDHCAGVAWELHTVNTFGLWATLNLGRIRELRHRWGLLTKEARERGDQYATTTLAAFFMTMVRLAEDDTEPIEDELAGAMAPWSRRGFLIQHASACRSAVHLDLYRGRVEQAWERFASSWPDYTRSLLSRIQIVRIQMGELRARCTLARAEIRKDPSPFLPSIEKDARALEREGQTWAIAHAEYLRAGIAACRVDATLSLHHLTRAVELYEESGMSLNAAVMRYRMGEIQVGDEARAMMADAELTIREQSIRSPGQWARMIAPGFAAIATCPAETSY